MVLFFSDLARGCSFSQSMPLLWPQNTQKELDTWVQIGFLLESRQGLILTSV